MLKAAFKAFLGSRHKREAKKLQPIIDEINDLYDGLSSLSDSELLGKTDEFRERINADTADLKAGIEELREQKRHSQEPSERERLSFEINDLENQLLETIEETLEDILPEAFAVVKDACRRLVGREVTVTGQPLTWDMIPYDVLLVGAIAEGGRVESVLSPGVRGPEPEAPTADVVHHDRVVGETERVPTGSSETPVPTRIVFVALSAARARSSDR